MSATSPPPLPVSRLEELRVSARGWHGVQLAIIGFIGFCGVLADPRPGTPTWLQNTAGVLALSALVLACAATFLVGRVAWPLYGGEEPGGPDTGEELGRDGRRLRTGLVLTFAALAALALGNAAGWWPEKERGGGGGGLVQVQAATGQRWCGTLGEASPGAVSVVVGGSPVVVPLQNVAVVRSVASC